MEKEIILKPKYELKDFLRFSFSNISSSWGFKFVILLAFFMLITDVLNLFKIDNLFLDSLSIFNIIFPLLVFVLFPLILYLITKYSFNKNFRLKEDVSIIMNSSFMIEKGETFEVKTPWNKIESVYEKKHLFLINHNKHQKGFLSKKHFSKQELIDFKNLLNSISIKKKLI